jgi:hypothetical protein
MRQGVGGGGGGGVPTSQPRKADQKEADQVRLYVDYLTAGRRVNIVCEKSIILSSHIILAILPKAILDLSDILEGGDLAEPVSQRFHQGHQLTARYVPENIRDRIRP